MFRTPLLLALLVTLLALACGAQAANFTVSTTADSGAGSLRQAILDSNSPAAGVNTITFTAAFPDNGVILLNSNLPQILSQSLIIMGVSNQPHVDGRSLHTLFSVSSGTSVLELSDVGREAQRIAPPGANSSTPTDRVGYSAVRQPGSGSASESRAVTCIWPRAA